MKMLKRAEGIIAHPLFSGSTIMIGGSMAANVINYLYHLIMGRLLGPSNYGVLSSLFALLYIITIIPLSASTSVVKFISSSKTKKETLTIYQGIKKFIFYLALITSLLFLMLSPLISEFLHIEELYAVVLISPIMFLSLVTLVNQATLQGLLKFVGVVGPNILSSAIKLLVGVFLVYLSLSVTGAIFGVLLAVALAYIYSVLLINKSLKGKAPKDKFDLAPFLRFSFPVLIQAFAFTAYFTVDIILVKHFLPAFEAGLYAALSTLGKIVFFAAAPVISVMFPIVSGRHARGKSYGRIFVYSLLLTILISGSVTLFYLFFPRLAISLLYGEKYLGVERELFWMGAFISLYTVSYFLVNFFLSIGETRVVRLTVFVLVFQILGIVFWHNTILRVIQISLLSMVLLFVGVLFFLIYNQLPSFDEKKR